MSDNRSHSSTPATGLKPGILGKPEKSAHRNRILLAIGLFKFVKVASLVTAGILVIHFRNANLSKIALHWINAMRMDPHNYWIDMVLDHIARIHKSQMEMLAGGTFVYALIFAVEGVGLMLEKAWGEYLVLVDTALLLPLEVYEVAKKPDILRIGLLLGNALIFAYLTYLRVKAHRVKKAMAAAAISLSK